MFGLPEVVKAYRSQQCALRRLETSKPTRNVGRTQRAIAWRVHDLAKLELGLVVNGFTELVGELREEHNLLGRLAEAKRHGIERPELRVRLKSTRARIRALSA